MPTNILMPALSPTMEKGNLARWLKKEGDKVKSGDVIAEIETDKARMECEAIDDGTLAKIVVPEGTQDVAVNAIIAVLANEGEDVKAAAAGAAKSAASPSQAQPAPKSAPIAPSVETRPEPASQDEAKKAPQSVSKQIHRSEKGAKVPVSKDKGRHGAGATRVFSSTPARGVA